MAEASSSLSVTETVTQEVCYVQERDFFFLWKSEGQLCASGNGDYFPAGTS